jgi:proline iminopeptidase
MSSLYPRIEPSEHGMLDVGDGHPVYWETCGNPQGKAVLVVHGGPGSGCTPGARRWFDPDRYRIVLFDQRNCGRSLPHASDPDVDLVTNDTVHLLGDMEALVTLHPLPRGFVHSLLRAREAFFSILAVGSRSCSDSTGLEAFRAPPAVSETEDYGSV